MESPPNLEPPTRRRRAFGETRPAEAGINGTRTAARFKRTDRPNKPRHLETCRLLSLGPVRSTRTNRVGLNLQLVAAPVSSVNVVRHGEAASLRRRRLTKRSGVPPPTASDSLAQMHPADVLAAGET
jgi:hypothetical protein